MASPDPVVAPAPPAPDRSDEVRDALLAEARQASEAPTPRRFPDLAERRLVNSSRMLKRPSLLFRMAWSWLFHKVTFDERHVRAIRDVGRDADVVFVMNHHSLLDYLYFNYAFLRFGLPLVWFANNLSMTVFRPLASIVFTKLARVFGRRRRLLEDADILEYGLERGLPGLVFLKRRGLWPWSPDQFDNRYLETALRVQRARTAAVGVGQRPRSVMLVPQLLVWSQNPNRYKRTLRDLVFGNPEAPGRLRKAINFVSNRRKAFVQVGQTIDLAEFLAGQPADAPPGELAGKLRFHIHQALSLEERVIKGPVVKDARRIRQELMRTPQVQGALHELSAEVGRPAREIERQMSRYLREMAADFSMAYIEAMCIVLTLVFDRLYSEVIPDREGLEKVREAGRRAPLVLLPCHRSHVDYLVISWIFYAHGLIPPHIAAGDNLSFWPLGHIFRRSGAFFIRRTFRDNPVYQRTFREYMRKLVREGYWIEFFPEGGRSRTGKMLPPKLGMLRTIIDAIKAGTAPDVCLVPIYVGYEQVIEERAYTAELSGGEKKKENITGLLRTTKVLWSRYGRLYASFAEPISVREALDEAGVADLADDDPRYQLFVRRMGYRVLSGIQDVALVTPSALTACALLAHARRGVRRELLLRRIGFLLDVASAKQAMLSKTLEHALRIGRPDIAAAAEQRREGGAGGHPLALGESSPVAFARGRAVEEAIDEALARYVKDKHVEVHEFEDDRVYKVAPSHRINLDFYKNNIVHLLVPEAILAAAARTAAVDGEVTLDALRDGAAFLSETLKYEFVYDPDRDFAALFEETLDAFRQGGLLVPVPVAIDAAADLPPPRLSLGSEPPASDTLELLHELLRPWLEAYWVLVRQLDAIGDKPVSDRELMRRAQRTSRQLFEEGDVACPEAASTTTLKQALTALIDLGRASATRKGRDRMIAPVRPDGAPGLEAMAECLRNFLAP